jgi:hypothetical protein
VHRVYSRPYSLFQRRRFFRPSLLKSLSYFHTGPLRQYYSNFCVHDRPIQNSIQLLSYTSNIALLLSPSPFRCRLLLLQAKVKAGAIIQSQGRCHHHHLLHCSCHLHLSAAACFYCRPKSRQVPSPSTPERPLSLMGRTSLWRAPLRCACGCAYMYMCVSVCVSVCVCSVCVCLCLSVLAKNVLAVLAQTAQALVSCLM